MPVALPPGRLMLVTSPSVTGSSPALKTIGMLDVAALAARPERWPPVAAAQRLRRPNVDDQLDFRPLDHDHGKIGRIRTPEMRMRPLHDAEASRRHESPESSAARSNV